MVASDDSVVLRKIKQFEMADLHPYSIAATLVKGGVIFDHQYNNIFYRLSKKLERDKFEIHYITDKQKSFFSIDTNVDAVVSDQQDYKESNSDISVDNTVQTPNKTDFKYMSFINDHKKHTYPRLNMFGDKEIIPNRIYIPS